MTYYNRKLCRMCNGSVEIVSEFTPTPIANAFADEPDEGAQRYPLAIVECHHCKHVQASFVISPEILFGNVETGANAYKYSTPQAVSPELAATATKLRNMMPEARRVLEIGCNNGINVTALTKAYEGCDYFDHVCGVDPAAPEWLLRGYFSEKWARTFAQQGEFDLIVANNVFAHIDDLDDVFKGIRYCLSDGGLLVVEVQYLVDLVKKCAWDMIYHEHHDYHTVGPWLSFLRRYGMRLAKWERIKAHGGSIRLYARHDYGTDAMAPNEKIDWDAFNARVSESCVDLYTALEDADGPIAMFGATAKACTLIHHSGIAPMIEFCVDETPQKQMRYIPGTNIQILPPSALKERGVRTVLLSAWNYENILRPRLADYEVITPFSVRREYEATS